MSKTQAQVLQALMTGSTLKSHRYLDGAKIYRLHPLVGSAHTVRSSTVEALRRNGLIDSNKKFPAATYLLTEKGRGFAETLEPGSTQPLSASNY